MSAKWKQLGDAWMLECSASQCAGLITCTHTFDTMTSVEPSDVDVPDGKIRLPMAGEFPNVGSMRDGMAMTAERFGTFDVDVSAPINDYGTRKVMLPTVETPQFLMMLNPEDAIVSIYRTVQEFINSQVGYQPGDAFGNCSGSSHRIQSQKELSLLANFIDAKPMIKMWDLLSKLQTGSCIVCMWRRAEANTSASAAASGLGSL